MKILVLNPQINAQHKVAGALRARGDALLFATDAEDAMQILALHGSSIDLALVHREAISGDDTTPGITLLKKIKADPAQRDLAVILSSSQWGERDFGAHQATREAANAYLKYPYGETQITQLIDEVFGIPTPSNRLTGLISSPSQLKIKLPIAPSVYASQLPEIDFGTNPEYSSPLELPALEGFQLEDAAPLFQSSEVSALGESPPFVISLDAPQMPAEPPVESGGVPTFESVPFEIQSISLGETPAQVVIEAPVEVPIEFVHEASPEMVEEMPYISNKVSARDPLQLVRPVGDSIVPGGAASSPDTETIKKYLYLREQDVAILSSQLKASQEQIKNLDQAVREERAINIELTHLNSERQKKIEEFESQTENERASLERETVELRFQLKTKTDKARLLESQVKEATNEIERLKERVRSDIRKIRAREKELENKLEILKKDSEVLMGARDAKIMELKRKLDLLEFNMDLLQDQYVREKESSAKLRELFAKAAQVVRVAGGILDTSGATLESAELDQRSVLTDNKKEAS